MTWFRDNPIAFYGMMIVVFFLLFTVWLAAPVTWENANRSVQDDGNNTASRLDALTGWMRFW